MIHLMHVITDTNIGGAGIWVLNTVRELTNSSVWEKSYKVTVVIPTESMLYERLQSYIPEEQIIQLASIKDLSFSIQGIIDIHRVLKKIKPDLVHTHASLSGRIAALAFPKIKVVNSRHCMEPVPTGVEGWLKKLINNTLSHKILGVSQGIYENLLECGAKKEKTVLVSNGIRPLRTYSDKERLEIRQSYGIEEPSVVIGFMGRLEQVKGTDYLIEVIKELRDESFTVLIAGDGSQRSLIEKDLKEEMDNGTVNYLGFVKDVEPFYNAIDIYINTSRTEGISLSIIEAMSVNKPIVGFEVGGLDQVVKNNSNGFLINPYDTAAYARRLAKLIEEEELRKSFGNESHELMKNKFHIDKMIERLDQVYKEVLK